MNRQELVAEAWRDHPRYIAEVRRLFPRAFALRDRLAGHACPYGSCPAVGTILRINSVADSVTVIDHALLHRALDLAEAHVAQNPS